MILENFIKLISALGGEIAIKKSKAYIPFKLAA